MTRLDRKRDALAKVGLEPGRVIDERSAERAMSEAVARQIAHDAKPGLLLIGKTVSGTDVLQDQSLTIEFTDGSKLRITGHVEFAPPPDELEIEDQPHPELGP